jgi:hypothetical protein
MKGIDMKSANEVTLVDEARQLICHRFARMLNAGSFSVRVRITQSPGEEAARFYSHRHNEWHKDADPITDPQLVQAVDETMEMLASREHTDQWLARKHSSSDYRDVDLQFHRDKLEHRLGAQLEAALAGFLFRDSHASAKDVRRGIRTPRSGGP